MTIYEDIYKSEEYYWGLEPSHMCYRVMELLPPVKPYRLLDIGCGEGKDAVFFAKNGYEVYALDFVQAGLDKAQALAEKHLVGIHTIKADVKEFRLDFDVDVIYSSGVLHYIPPELRAEIFASYKSHTRDGGIHAFNVFIHKPFIKEPPEDEPFAYPWRSGELFMCYADWRLRSVDEIIFDCNSSGVPHQHCMDVVMAEKVSV